MVRIPSEYQEVEYIESTGRQYIVTDIEGRFSMTFESDIEFTGGQDSYSVGFLDGDFRIGGNGYYGNKTQICYGSTYNLGAYIKLNTKYNYKTIFEPGVQKVFIDGELTSTHNLAKNATTLTGKHVGIFARLNNDKGASLFSKAKIYNLKILDGDRLLGNFIPCYRKSSGEIGMYDTVSKQFYTNSGTGTFLKGNDVTYDNISLLESRRRILLNTPHIETVSDTIASFKTDVATKLKGCKVYFTPIQEGEGDPSPENVRPIHGRDGVTVTACGKNLASKLYGYNTNGGDSLSTRVIVSGENNTVSSLVPIKPGLKYALSLSGTPYNGRYFWFKENPMDGTEISIGGGYTVRNVIATAPENAKYLFVLWTRTEETNTCGNVQVEIASSPTVYEPYQEPQVLTIPFPQTIYGGYVDLVKGEVVEEWKEYVYPNKTNIFNDLGNGYYEVGFGEVGGKGYGSSNNSMCSKLSYGYKSSTLEIGYILDYVLLNQSGRFHTLVHSETSLTADTARQWFIDNNIQLVREVYSPTVYPIDPQTLKALRGMNNIWSDANGSIEVSFYTH